MLQKTIGFMVAAVALTTSYGASAFELPFLKEEALALGHKLPPAYGISSGYMKVEQGVNIDSIGFSGLKFLNKPIATDAIDITTTQGQQMTEVFHIRADAWLLPFLNLYAIGGKVQGYSDTDISINKFTLPSGTEIPLPDSLTGLPFRLDLDGYVYGAGVTVAGGTGNWFTLIDASYTKTDLTVIDGEISTFVLSPRLGYEFTVNQQPLRLWIGAMYQDIDQFLTGQINDLDLPSEVKSLLDLVNRSGDGKFEVNQHLTSPWNGIVGAQYQINHSLSLMTEWGFGSRQSAMFTIEARF